jgi:hypothetical protein
MLGAYGLLTDSGELSVASARIIGAVLGGRASLPAKELLPIIQAEAAVRRHDLLPDPVTSWQFLPENCPVCKKIVESWFPSQRYRQQRNHLLSHPGIGINLRSALTCLGIEEFIAEWSGLGLGQLWDPRSITQSDRALASCVRQLVFKMGQATRSLERLGSQSEKGAPRLLNERVTTKYGHLSGHKTLVG